MSEEVERAILDHCLEHRTTKVRRPHRGRGTEGRVPYAVFKAGLKEAKKAWKSTPKKEAKEAA